MDRKAKIVATLGPSSNSPEIIRRLIMAGMDVARLNFSHGSHEDHSILIENIRTISLELNHPVALLQDLQGPKIRVGNLSSPIELVAGEIVSLYSADASAPEGEGPSVPVDFSDFFY